MGKKWDYDVPSVEVFQEMLRVAKPGAFLLCFGGSRTFHRMACNIEDAGWQIRDTMLFLYGSGFPKAYDVSKGISKKENGALKLWVDHLKSAKFAGGQLEKNPIGIGMNIEKKDFVPVIVQLNISVKKSLLNVIIAELKSSEVHHMLIKNQTIVQENVEVDTRQLQKNVKLAKKQSQNHNHNLNIITFSVQWPVKELLNEKIINKIKEEEALKTWLGNNLFCEKTNINVKFVELIENLKHIILNQSKTFQSLDMKSQMECVSAINVIITESTMECLIISTVNMLKENWSHHKSAMKPSYEPIIVAMKPIDKNFVNNALTHGVAGLNIDGSRIGTEKLEINGGGKKWRKNGKEIEYVDPINEQRVGRFPANIILDHEAAEMLDKQSGVLKSGKMNGTYKNTMMKNDPGNRDGKEVHLRQEASSGGASRFFKQCNYSEDDDITRFFYTAKASRKERNAGCEGLEEKESQFSEWKEGERKKQNNHPTVKPVSLMEYLCKLTKPPTGGTVLDPYAGSGTTGCACINTDRDFIGIELEEDYVEIAKKRIEYYENKRKEKLFP